MICWVALAASMVTLQAPQDPAPGISQQLAEARRARLGEVAYELHFTLDPAKDAVDGSVRCRFTLAADGEPAADLALDFGGEALDDVTLNSSPMDAPRRVADHVVLPRDSLTAGENVFAAHFRSAVAATGTPLSRYDDAAAGQSYEYTLLVPADAHRLFPCFDQPDVKACFSLTLDHPAKWVVVANAPAKDTRAAGDDRRVTAFEPTAPLPTYLFAFAAGPFDVVEDDVGTGAGEDPERNLRIFVRPSKREHLEAERVFAMHRAALAWLGDYFGTPYPFAKLDLVLVPGFPYGGMEHAGAIFYRESAVVFERELTEVEQHRRSTLIYHEVAHQWFGDLVTMVWFDDLWLKEGFATFIAYHELEALEPGSEAWLRFLQRVKPAAYRIDSTSGTTPIWQQLGNLDDAKSAYGPIVYNKAPAVLRELEARLGPEKFRAGVRLFLSRHAFGNARWTDLIAAFREASGLKGSSWSDRWILTAGMPRVAADWSAERGHITGFAIRQESTDGGSWPLALEIMLVSADGTSEIVRVDADSARTEVPRLIGHPAPAAVLLNPRDIAYGEFLLDARSREFLLQHLELLDDPVNRAEAVAALWQAVRDADLDPARFATMAIERLAGEDDPLTHASFLGMLGTCLDRYLGGEQAAPLRTRAEDAIRDDLVRGRKGLALQSLQFLERHGRSEPSLAMLRRVLTTAQQLPGLELDDGDRFDLAAALLAAGQHDAVDLARARVEKGHDVAKEAFLAGAAAADPAVKAHYFATYLQLGEPPEQWMQDSLGYFHWPGQNELILPWLDNALDRVLWVKAHRRIFFMPAWIDAFVNAHASTDALSIVERFLDRHPDLPVDVRRKVLQSTDDLRRAVAIRKRFASSGR